MIELSVGQVAGIIAAATVLVRTICPLALTFLLANQIRDTESASTWSLASQAFQSSYWPTILRSDTSNSARHIRRPIRFLSASTTALALLATVSGVITPLGLVEKWSSKGTEAGLFEYAHDNSSFAIATSVRGNGTFHRVCADVGHGTYGFPRPCPYTGDTMETTQFKNGSVLIEYPYGIHTAIPDILRDIFSSGTAGRHTTVSNSFDIEWRQLTKTASDENINNGTVFEKGTYRQLDSVLVRNGYELFEGLVIDNNIGGIGFRNHTIPTGLSHGATWKEDLLFVEPDISCVNTNLSIDFEVSTASPDNGFRYIAITDRGGFAGLNVSHVPIDRQKSQSKLDLQARAYDAAYLNNAYTMMVYNITNRVSNSTGRLPFSYLKSSQGQEFPLNGSGRYYRALALSNGFGSYFSDGGWRLERYPNPFNITVGDLESISNMCTGTDDTAGQSAKYANISNIYVTCGLLRGAPMRVNEGPPFIFDQGSKWSSPLYTCAAAVQATIKTVSFSFNTTSRGGLEGLKVTAISPKEYLKDDEMPLWGFEETGLTFDGVDPLWGLISPNFATHPNVSSVRQPFFHIPGYRSSVGYLSSNFPNAMPSSIFASIIMDQVFNFDDTWRFDLQGSSSLAVFRRWQSLSQDAVSAATIIKLTWTDLATSAVVGTKGTFGRLNEEKRENAARTLITPIRRTISYHVPYGIPAFLLLLCLVAIGITSLISVCLQSASLERLRLRIKQTSVGRVYTTYAFPDESSLSMSSEEWRIKNGSRLVKLTDKCEEG